MSKLEDKLTASIKPGKTAPATDRRPRPATRKPARVPADTVPEASPAAAQPAPSDSARQPHPRRVWPD